MAEGETPSLFRPRPVGARYLLTRAVLLRGLGFIYVVAFAILAHQARPLIGAHGLLPATSFLARVWRHFEGPTAAFYVPTLFWLDASDTALTVAAWCGVVLGALVLAGVANAPILVALWALYLSFVHVGQVFYGYGWDILLCEAGFLAVFLAPAWRVQVLHRAEPPPFVVTCRWVTWLVTSLPRGSMGWEVPSTR